MMDKYCVCGMTGMLAEQFTVDGPKLHLYNSSTQHWDKLMNWQHTTMYLFFGLAGATSLTIHSASAAPLALDRLLLGLAFFNEGKTIKDLVCNSPMISDD